MMAPPGSLRVCQNGHITRGGEISKRRALVPWKSAADTKGLAALVDDVYVFGSTVRPAALDPAIFYQRLQAPSGSPLARVTSYDIFDGKLYVAAEFVDGTVAHFYDGVLVADWFDGRARASFNVVGGVATEGTNATASFDITAASAGSALTAVRVGSAGVDNDNLVSGPVAFSVDAAGTAAAVAANINANTVGATAAGSIAISAAAAGGVVTAIRVGTSVSPNLLTAPVPFNTSAAVTAANVAANITANAASPYTAAAAAGVITLTAKANTAADNGKTIIGEKTGAITFGAVVAIAGGNKPAAYTAQADGVKVILTRKTKDAVDNGKTLQVSHTGTMTTANLVSVTGGLATAQVSSIKADGIEILGAPVAWAASNNATAAAIVAQINSFVSVPEYDAQQDGPKVVIIAHDSGTVANGKNIEVIASGDISVIPANTTLLGGFDAATFVPGKFVKTINAKMYSPESSVLHFSGVEEPTLWNSSATGAGFINMANQDGQSQELLAIERYYSRSAIFGRRNVQIWNIDVDPAQNQQVQVLKNTGLIAPKSVQQFGDSDVFYLNDSGVRSLRARDSSTAAAVNDIGTPVDELVVQKIHDVGDTMAAQAVAFIEPIAGRYIIAIGDTVYSYSNFPGGKISAWSTYDFSGLVWTDVVTVRGDHIVVRGDDDMLYQIGGPDGDDYDNSLLAVELPLMDAAKAATNKVWQGMDLVCEGTWRIYAGFEALAPDARELIAEVSSPTLSMQRITLAGSGTHASIRLECDDAGPARLSNFILHYELGDAG